VDGFIYDLGNYCWSYANFRQLVQIKPSEKWY
jgi:hypothetical protein